MQYGFDTTSKKITHSLIVDDENIKNLLQMERDAVKALNKIREDMAIAGKVHVQAGWDYSHCTDFQNRIRIGQTISPESGFTYYSPGNEVLKHAPGQAEDPYKNLARHHELKSILNCGILTKAEKRKVLGLPELQEGQNDQ